ncbi:MAG: alpha-amylase [Treponema sp.]|jgi:glycosidase|nr:alpha-amylase [Treponema sp.]
MEDFSDKVFYHLYPLGFCGAPERNDFACPAGGGLRSIAAHIPRLGALGVNALYIGPLFESASHGYDTVDYFHVDRRLGNNDDLAALVRAMHDAGILVILDAVFNHTGRDFFAFKDLREHRQNSRYAAWYAGLDFSRNNQHNDGFLYADWAGHSSLVKLNADCAEMREHLFAAVDAWIDLFDIDGLRLDAANVMSIDFLRELSRRGKAKRPGFYLLGETVAGDYRGLAHEGCLDSVTNYELYKALWSSFNDKNFFELQWALKRQFGPEGLYRDLALYNFADNHDVNRVASVLKKRAHLFPLYGALFCLPGAPSIYYGSEYGIKGEKERYSDRPLRPAWDEGWQRAEHADALFSALARFSALRRGHPALRRGLCRELFTGPEDAAFLREAEGEQIIVTLNAAESPGEVRIPQRALDAAGARARVWRDLLDAGCSARAGESGAGLTVRTPPCWLRVLLGEDA